MVSRGKNMVSRGKIIHSLVTEADSNFRSPESEAVALPSELVRRFNEASVGKTDFDPLIGQAHF